MTCLFVVRARKEARAKAKDAAVSSPTTTELFLGNGVEDVRSNHSCCVRALPPPPVSRVGGVGLVFFPALTPLFSHRLLPACPVFLPPLLPSSGMDLLSMAQKADKFQEQMDSMKRRMVREDFFFDIRCIQNCGLSSVVVLVRAAWRVISNIEYW